MATYIHQCLRADYPNLSRHGHPVLLLLVIECVVLLELMVCVVPLELTMTQGQIALEWGVQLVLLLVLVHLLVVLQSK